MINDLEQELHHIDISDCLYQENVAFKDDVDELESQVDRLRNVVETLEVGYASIPRDAVTWDSIAKMLSSSPAAVAIANSWAYDDLTKLADLERDRLEELAEGGDMESQREMGNILRQGKGIEKDTDAALGWYRKAAKQGDEESEAIIQSVIDGTFEESEATTVE